MSKTSVKGVVIEVPENLRDPPGELEERLRVDLALRLYEKGIASLGQARMIAELPEWDFLELPARERVLIHYGEEKLGEDLELTRNYIGG